MLVLMFDELVSATDASGLILIGTGITVTGLLGGSGTNTLTFSLSGSLSVGGVGLQIGANTIQTLDGFQLHVGSATAVATGASDPVPSPAPPFPPPPVRITHASSATVLVSFQTALVDVSGGAPPSITTPATPTDMDPIWIVDAVGSFASTSCTVTANAGQTIEDPNIPGTFGATAVASLDGAFVQWLYDGAQSRWKLGAVCYPIGGNSGSITTVTYDPVVVLTAGHRRMVWAGGGIAATLVRAASGHVSGGQLSVEYPANTATSLAVSQDFNIRGDLMRDSTTGILSPWDATKAHVVELAQIGAITEGVILEIDTPDVSAPAIVSATANAGNPNAVTITFDSPVWFGGAHTGITTNFTVGTSRTITALASGDGTASPVFTLSGNLDGSESFTVIVGSGRTATDLSGNLLAINVGVSVAISGFSSSLAAQAAWTQCFESGVTMLPATSLPASFTAWNTEVAPGSLQITPATGTPPARTAAPDAALRFDAGNNGTGAERCNVAASLGAGDFAFLIRASDLTTGQWTYLNFNTSGVDNVRAKLQFNPTGITFETFDGAAEVLQEITFTLVAGTRYIVGVSRVGSNVTITVAGQTPATITDAAVLTSIDNATLGCEWVAGGTFQEGERGDITDFAWKTGAGFVGSELADSIAYLNAR